jgi:hypothetical protein
MPKNKLYEEDEQNNSQQSFNPAFSPETLEGGKDSSSPTKGPFTLELRQLQILLVSLKL